VGEWLALIRSASCLDLDSRRTPLRQEHHPVCGRGRCTAFHACRRVAAVDIQGTGGSGSGSRTL